MQRKQVIRTEVIILIIIILAFAIPGCLFGPDGSITTAFAGPTDAEIEDARQYAASLPPEHPDKPAADARVAQLVANRRAAQERVDTVSMLANAALPGAGVALGVLYGVLQKLRNRKSQTALEATMVAIEEFKRAGGDDSAAALITALKESHNKAGVRDAIRDALAKLKTVEHKE